MDRPEPPTKKPRLDNDVRNVAVNDWVAAIYNNDWFMGKVTEIDETDREVLVDFLENSGKLENTFKWPVRKDEIWVSEEQIIHVLTAAPVPVGRRERSLKITEQEKEIIYDRFLKYRKTK
jgi:hypothetical protein